MNRTGNRTTNIIEDTELIKSLDKWGESFVDIRSVQEAPRFSTAGGVSLGDDLIRKRLLLHNLGQSRCCAVVDGTNTGKIEECLLVHYC